MEPKQQKQRQRRVEKRLALRLGGSRTDPGLIGYTQDVSPLGLCISTETIEAPGSLVRIKLRLPDNGICRLTGYVAWSRSEGGRAGRMGIRLESPPPAFLALIGAPERSFKSQISTAIESELDEPIVDGILMPMDDEPAETSAPTLVRKAPRRRILGPLTHRLIAVTGGVSSRKAELLAAMQEQFRGQLMVLPDLRKSPAGLPRPSPAELFDRIVELEEQALESGQSRVALCQSSTLDCLDRWQGDEASFWREMKTTLDAEYARYDMVIHLRPPVTREGGTRSLVNAHLALEQVWKGHPRRSVIDWRPDFRQQLAVLVAQVITRVSRAA